MANHTILRGKHKKNIFSIDATERGLHVTLWYSWTIIKPGRQTASRRHLCVISDIKAGLYHQIWTDIFDLIIQYYVWFPVWTAEPNKNFNCWSSDWYHPLGVVAVADL